MSYILQAIMLMLILALLGLASWQLEMRERNERLTEEALQTAQVLETSLEERLHEMDRYRHDLAELLQELDIEQVRAAESRASE
jgi:cytochrome oxidase assembly protein ShyY1